VDSYIFYLLLSLIDGKINSFKWPQINLVTNTTMLSLQEICHMQERNTNRKLPIY